MIRTAEVRDWLKQNGYTHLQIEAEIGLCRGSLSKILANKAKNRHVFEWLLLQGCPIHYLAQGGKLYQKPGRPRLERIKRTCLKCDRPFMADGRFNRICPLCKVNNESVLTKYYVIGEY